MTTSSGRTALAFLLAVALGIFAVAANDIDGHRYITCGSAIKLRHMNSSRYFLKSASANYKSDQQVVTCGVDGDLMWQVSVHQVVYILHHPPSTVRLKTLRVRVCYLHRRRFERLTTKPLAHRASRSGAATW